MKLRLVKGRSYSDMSGTIATAQKPVAEIADPQKALVLIATGYFIREADAPEPESRKKTEKENSLPYEPEEDQQTAASVLKEQLEAMTVAELKKYAESHGVSLKSGKKDEIITALMDADMRAQEARKSLREQ